MMLAAFAIRERMTWGMVSADEVLDVPAICARDGVDCPADLRGLLEVGAEDFLSRVPVDDAADEPFRHPIDQVRLLAPLRNAAKIIGIGRNYLDHADEADLVLPAWPKVFPKFGTTVVGPGDAVIRPGITRQLDFEVEIAVVIGKTARRVSEAEALGYLGGYTIINDISARDIQFADEQLTLGKNFETFCPMGPYLVLPSTLPDPAGIALRLRLNGQVMQESTTSSLIFSIPYLISFLSYVMTLEPGDLIATGTPAGVGCFRTPPVWLQDGDVIESEVDGIGTLVNTVISDDAPPPYPSHARPDTHE